MIDETEYAKQVSVQHRKRLGQYFTNAALADFMCVWACPGAKTMLDPAAGNGVFLVHARKHNTDCALTGYEIDKGILACFGNPAGATILNEDYLLSGWEDRYDAIVCNPPYHRFQAVSNRNDILERIHAHTGIRYSGYTNLSILFLIKSIFQLSDTGKLAYIVPSEFLNAKYGTPFKRLLLDRRLLRAIIHFENDAGLFLHATTTCCIVLLDRGAKEHVDFYQLSSVEALSGLAIGRECGNSVRVRYDRLDAEGKWRTHLHRESKREYANITNVSTFCTVTRGIATGANEFFCFTRSKAQRHGIPMDCLSRCICRSADVRTAIFTDANFQDLSESDQTVYLLDVRGADAPRIRAYIEWGERRGVDKRYLPSHRTPWFSMEQKPPAPIWVSSACRGGMKFVRNLAEVKALTTFHSIFVKEAYRESTDLIFCYFLTPVAQRIMRENRKEMGNGLEKYQPNDLNTASMLDIRAITERDRNRICEIYREMRRGEAGAAIERLNAVFTAYLIP